MTKKSLFIVVEGLDGSGKTSAGRHLANFLNTESPARAKLTFQPHDPSCAGLFIRQVLMKKLRVSSPRTLALAFAANRLDHCEREINPWLDGGDGNIVICDRYYLSSLVYQSSDTLPFQAVWELNSEARKPDIIFFLNVSNEVCYERMKIRNEPKELFEENLSEIRGKYDLAMKFLREKNAENIVEIDASGEIEDVIQKMLDEIYILNSELKPEQPLPSENLIRKHPMASLNGKNEYTLENCVDELSVLKNLKPSDISSDEEKFIHLIERELDSYHFHKLGGFFLDYVKSLGIQVNKKLAWSDLDAYELEYTMPGEILLRGAALIIQERQRYDVIMKKAPEIPELSDFMLVFLPGPSELVTDYYERDKIKYNTEIRQDSLFPSTRLVTQKDLSVAILKLAINKVPEKG